MNQFIDEFGNSHKEDVGIYQNVVLILSCLEVAQGGDYSFLQDGKVVTKSFSPRNVTLKILPVFDENGDLSEHYHHYKTTYLSSRSLDDTSYSSVDESGLEERLKNLPKDQHFFIHFSPSSTDDLETNQFTDDFDAVPFSNFNALNGDIVIPSHEMMKSIASSWVTRNSSSEYPSFECLSVLGCTSFSTLSHHRTREVNITALTNPEMVNQTVHGFKLLSIYGMLHDYSHMMLVAQHTVNERLAIDYLIDLIKQIDNEGSCKSSLEILYDSDDVNAISLLSRAYGKLTVDDKSKLLSLFYSSLDVSSSDVEVFKRLDFSGKHKVMKSIDSSLLTSDFLSIFYSSLF